jgi:hypothetical protein
VNPLLPATAYRAALGASLLCANRRFTIATFVTLLLVPVLYSIFVLDLKLIRWETAAPVEPEALALHAD